MLLLVTVVLLTLGTTLMFNIYSVFNPFIDNLGDIKDYNIAYYGALASVERAELSLRYHKAGFDDIGGGRTGSNNIGPDSDYNKKKNFGRISKLDNGMKRKINSLISGNTIPESGEGNIEPALRGTDSKDRNKLGYNLSEEFPLYVDTTNDPEKYYEKVTDTNIEQIEPDSIIWKPKLPPKIKNNLPGNSLAENSDIDGDGIKDDIIVNRNLFGKDSNGNQFNIQPTIDVDYSAGAPGPQINEKDTAIRESYISNNITFGNNFNPTNPSCTLCTGHNIIPENSTLSGKDFNTIFDPLPSEEGGTGLHLKFSIVNLMKGTSDSLYPFLEYKLEFIGSSKKPSDRFFRIKGSSKVGKYKAEIKIDKPVVESTASSDFTIIF